MKRNNINLARKLRKKQTPQEVMIWARLRNRQFHNLKFRRQYTIDKYIVDFVCLDKKLIIELDGWQHKEKFCGDRESERAEILESQGYKIVRFWNDEVNNNIEGVFLKLGEIIEDL